MGAAGERRARGVDGGLYLLLYVGLFAFTLFAFVHRNELPSWVAALVVAGRRGDGVRVPC